MTSKVSDARTRLYDALTAALVDMPWRAHLYPPVQLSAPCVYIGPVEQRTEPPLILLRFPVVAVFDGADRRQVEQADDTSALISDAVFAARGVPLESRAIRLDVGGPTLRAVEYQAELAVQSMTLCPPLLQEA